MRWCVDWLTRPIAIGQQVLTGHEKREGELEEDGGEENEKDRNKTGVELKYGRSKRTYVH